MATGKYPDGLAYDPDDHKVFVSNEEGGTDTVIDVATNQRVADIDVGSDVGNTQYDGQSHRIFVAVGGRNQLVEIDPAANKVLAQHPVPGCEGEHVCSQEIRSAQATARLYSCSRPPSRS